MKRNVISARQQGFTLIELVVVIVILGILAATAVPKFLSMDTEAKTGVVNAGKAGAQSAAVTKYSKNLIAGTPTDGKATFASVTSSVVLSNSIVSGSCTAAKIKYT